MYIIEITNLRTEKTSYSLGAQAGKITTPVRAQANAWWAANGPIRTAARLLRTFDEFSNSDEVEINIIRK